MAEQQTRSTVKKRLQATAEASAYQKKWFQSLKGRVEAGEDFGYLNADVPMEILRTMDIPFVVNQWWAAICGAKRMTKKYFGLLRDAGYRDDLCSYCATAFAESLDPEDHLLDGEGTPLGPWGGLLLIILACIVGLVMAFATGAGQGKEFPFGPSIALAAWPVYLFSQAVLTWYLGLF